SEKLTKTQKAFEAGKLIAKAALKKNIKKVKFDRGLYLFHGRVRAVAEGAREAGLLL
ncbi:MAG: 50S ribosomal protein L18, partial [Candidatus Shapirobacteria bacterium]